jgi:DNA-binding winged helix-turn-helix (wHTH) protein
LRLFRWLAAGPITAGYDLRQLGWQLLDEPDPACRVAVYPLLVRPVGLKASQWRQVAGPDLAARRWVLLVGVDDPRRRARLLRLGFGDALGVPAALQEVEARTLRLIERAGMIPRQRLVGAVRLDLLERDAYVAGRAARLHPREFALFWRLADQPGRGFSATELLADVWRLAFRPETNSLAVHISRLRSKLRIAGADGLIETLPSGAYRLVGNAGSKDGLALPLPAGNQFALDGHVRLGKERRINRLQASSAGDEEDIDHGT